jgi:pimeloyl-ACP methyl ester carboxylesterase
MHAGLVTLVFMLVGMAALLCGAAMVLMAWSLIHPPRMTDGKAAWVLRRLSPADLGLGFEEMRFGVRDENGKPLDIAAWWIPHPEANGRCVVIIHGYADAKVGAIAWAPVWHSLGFHILVPDLRAHGESGGATTTAGYFERHDMVQVLAQLRARRADDTRQVVVFGLSMGAAVAAATAAEVPEIDALVMDSPYADFRHAAMAHMNRLGLPGKWLQRPAIRLAAWLTRTDYDKVKPTKLLKTIRCPVFLIKSGNDSFLSDADRLALARARDFSGSPNHDDAWTVPDVEHLMCLPAEPDAYRARLESFLARALDGTNSASSSISRKAEGTSATS